MAYLKNVLILLFFISLPVSSSYLKEPLKVKFATEASYYPFEYLDDNGTMVGFDIDIAKSICKAALLVCSFENQSFDSLLLALKFERFDAIIAAVDITEDRKNRVDFSEVYYKTSPVFLSKIENENFSLEDKLIGVQAGSSNYDYLLKNTNENTLVIAYTALSKAFLDLKRGRLDYVFVDKEVAKAFLSKADSSEIAMVNTNESDFLQYYSIGYGIAVKKKNYRLLNRIDLGLKKIKKNGEYQRIYDRYFN